MLLLIRSVITYLWTGISMALYSIVCVGLLMVSKEKGYQVGVLWCRHLLACGGVSIEVDGLEKMDRNKNYIVVGNHQSHLDVHSLIESLPLHLVFIAKKELFQMPFLGWGMKALGHIAIDRSSARSARDSFMAATERLKESKNESLVIFPEGTRSLDGSIGAFKQGSFTLPMETGLPILPVAISGTYQALPKGKIMMRPAKVTIRIGDPIDSEYYTGFEKGGLSQYVREKIVAMVSEHTEI